MRYCVKCGKDVRETWKFCLSCGAEVPAEGDQAPPADGASVICRRCGRRVDRADAFCSGCGRSLSGDAQTADSDGEIRRPPVLRPPEPGAADPADALREPGAGRADLELPRRRDRGDERGAGGRPGARPAVLLSLIVAAVLVAGIANFLIRGSEGRSEEGVAPAQPDPAASHPAPAVPPADSIGALERVQAEAERQLRQAEDELRQALRAASAGADAGPDGAVETPALPDRSLVRDRIQGTFGAIQACAAGRTAVVNARVTFEGTSGRVIEATAGGDLPDGVRACVVEVLRGISMPAFADRTFTIDFSVEVGDPQAESGGGDG